MSATGVKAAPTTANASAMARLHGDRWSSFGAHAGISQISSLLTAADLKRVEILSEFDDAFLAEIAPDLTIAKWNSGATIFEAGTYLDLAFFIIDGEVEMSLTSGNAVGGPGGPIFSARHGGSGTGIVSAVPRPAASTPPKKRDSIVFLAAADFDLGAGERLRLKAGELFGEIGAMNGWPQSVTARTTSTALLLQIRLPALRKLRRKSKKLKQRIDQIYRERTLRQHLMSTPLLEGCSADAITQLAAGVELVSCQPGEGVAAEGDPIEHLILVRSGSLKVSQSMGVGSVAVSYVSKGSTLGESELILEDSPSWQVTATSVGHSELVRIPRELLNAFIQKNPAVQSRLTEVAVERIKEIGGRRSDLARADLLDFTLAKGLTQANSVLILDLEKCTRCDDCVRGCAATHGGTARFVREGEVYNGFLVARSCYHCQDPTCLVGCPTGAIARTNIGDTVAIDPAVCIGCGACAENCQYDSIVIHELGETWGADAMPAELRGQPRSVATKCDLCLGAPEGPACVSSCPHGAAMRVAGAEEFDLLLQSRRGRVSA